jgi:ribosomal protein S18 acetylase RimI-like enzyme
MELKPASAFSLEELAELFTDAFTGYIGVSVSMTAESLGAMIIRDGIDMDQSQIFVENGTAIGFGYIARRGSAIRLAAMGVGSKSQEHGVGTKALTALIEAAKARGDSYFELEVIEQNTRGVRLYTHAGFKSLRKLIGWETDLPTVPKSTAPTGLEEISIAEMAKAVLDYGSEDLPWQTAGFSVSHAEPPSLAFRLDNAYVMISNPEAEKIQILSLLVPPKYRQQGQATRILQALLATYPEKKWAAQPRFPEEYGVNLGPKFGCTPMKINQFQMRLDLTGN